LSHIGRVRSENQDRLLIRRFSDESLLVAVADGLGGGPAGAEAAQIAVHTLAEGVDAGNKSPLPCTGLCDLAQQANERILSLGTTDPFRYGMGSTLTAALINPRKLSFVHSGDSRIYLLHHNLLDQVSRDHRFLDELIASGDLLPEAAGTNPMRDMLDQCAGHPAFAPDNGLRSLLPGDRVLLCSDGLSDALSREMIGGLLAAATATVELIALGLLEAALAAGGGDNITLVVVQV